MTAATPPDADVQPVDEEGFRRAVAQFTTGVCVVTTRLDRHDHAMTANAFMSVSLDPLLVVVSVAQDARFMDAVLSTGAYGVSVLSQDQRGVARWLSTPGRPVVDQLAQVPHHGGPATGVALLDGALAVMECRLVAVHPAGDHGLVVGEVLHVEVAAAPPAPLLYHQGAYRRLTG